MYIYALLWKVSLFLKCIRYESKTFVYYRKDYGRKIRLEIIKIFYNIPIYAELQIYKNNLLPKSYFTRTLNPLYQAFPTTGVFKVHIFWEGHKILWNLHLTFVLCSNGQIYGGDFPKFCGFLRIYGLYKSKNANNSFP